MLKLGEAFKQFFPVKKYIKLIVAKELKGKSPFRYQIKKKKIKEDKIFDGVTVVKSSLFSLDTKEIISTYKNLWRIEQAFRCLKNVLNFKPIGHQKDETVRGHVYVCILAYLLMTTLEYRLKDYKDLPSSSWILIFVLFSIF